MKSALILGRAGEVYEEAAAALKLFTPDFVIAVNVIGRDWPDHIDHWVSFHPALFPRWIEQRKAAGRSGGMTLWSGIFQGMKQGTEQELPLQWVKCDGGSSGFLAVVVAVQQLNCDRVVLCGIPLTVTPRYDDNSPWEEGTVYRGYWEENLPMIRDKVRSMSGWTKDLLGAPDEAWFKTP